MSDLYEIRNIKDRELPWDNGCSCFTLKDIKKGTLLFEDNSNITLEKFKKRPDLYEVRKIEDKGYDCFALQHIM